MGREGRELSVPPTAGRGESNSHLALIPHSLPSPLRASASSLPGLIQESCLVSSILIHFTRRDTIWVGPTFLTRSSPVGKEYVRVWSGGGNW